MDEKQHQTLSRVVDLTVPFGASPEPMATNCSRDPDGTSATFGAESFDFSAWSAPPTEALDPRPAFAAVECAINVVPDAQPWPSVFAFGLGSSPAWRMPGYRSARRATSRGRGAIRRLSRRSPRRASRRAAGSLQKTGTDPASPADPPDLGTRPAASCRALVAA